MIISQSPQKNSSLKISANRSLSFSVLWSESFIVFSSPEKLVMLFLLTEFKPFPYRKMMIKLLKFDNFFPPLRWLSLKPVVDWQPLPRKHLLLLYFAGMLLPLEGSCDVVDAFKYCIERKTTTKNNMLFIIIIVSQLFNCRWCWLGSLNLQTTISEYWPVKTYKSSLY